MGGVSTLWSETNTDETQENKLWIRSSVIGEKLWNPTANDTMTSNINLARRLVSMENRLINRGINAMPVTSEFCARNIEVCFSKWHG